MELGVQQYVRVCTDPVCGVAEEQRPCTGPCMHFLFSGSGIVMSPHCYKLITIVNYYLEYCLICIVH